MMSDGDSGIGDDFDGDGDSGDGDSGGDGDDCDGDCVIPQEKKHFEELIQQQATEIEQVSSHKNKII